jgi:membrane protease YdiL (CAAX protease family)
VRGRAFALWGRFVAFTAVAWATVVFVDPPRPAASIPAALALVLGAVVGVVLFVVLARTPPARPSLAGVRLGVTVGKLAFLALAATNEELVWRRLVLGEALRAGPIAAVVVSTVAFAVAHRTRQAAHLVTGAAFGGAYVVTGSLAAPLAAHWTYNTLVAGAVDRARRPVVAEGA